MQSTTDSIYIWLEYHTMCIDTNKLPYRNILKSFPNDHSS